MISLIYSIEKNEENEYDVKAVVEDSVQVMEQTLLDPPEYGPAVCTSSFSLDEDESLPDNEEDLIEFLESLNLDWTPLPKDYWD